LCRVESKATGFTGIRACAIPTILAREQGCLFFMLGNAYGAAGHYTCRASNSALGLQVCCPAAMALPYAFCPRIHGYASKQLELGYS